jgi:hypothetical protein
MSDGPVNAGQAFTGARPGRKRFFSLSNDSFRGSLWAFLYCLLIILVCPLMLEAGISRYVVSFAALVGLPLVASLLILILRKASPVLR